MTEMSSTVSRIGIYPGTFDPVTQGHMDIIRRATRIVDQLIVGVAINAGKGPMFDVDERCKLVEEALKAAGGEVAARTSVKPFSSLLMDFAKENGSSTIIRGLRAVSDFEYEFQMAGMNRKLFPDVETVFLTPDEEYMFISATMVREIARFGGDVSQFVQPSVLERLRLKLERKP